MAIFGMGVMVGPTLGPTLGGWITDNYSWPWIFYINIPLGILAALPHLVVRAGAEYQVQRIAASTGSGCSSSSWASGRCRSCSSGASQGLVRRRPRSSIETGHRGRSAWSPSSGTSCTTEHPMVDLRDPQEPAARCRRRVRQHPRASRSIPASSPCRCSCRTTSASAPGTPARVILPGAIASAVTMAFAGQDGEQGGRAADHLSSGVVLFALSMWLHSHFTLETGQVDLLLADDPARRRAGPDLRAAHRPRRGRPHAVRQSAGHRPLQPDPPARRQLRHRHHRDDPDATSASRAARRCARTSRCTTTPRAAGSTGDAAHAGRNRQPRERHSRRRRRCSRA